MKTMEDMIYEQINSVKEEAENANDKQDNSWIDMAAAIREGVDSI